jgi:hypothetical protein
MIRGQTDIKFRMLCLLARFHSDVIQKPGRKDAQEASVEEQNNLVHIFINTPPDCIVERERYKFYWNP